MKDETTHPVLILHPSSFIPHPSDRGPPVNAEPRRKLLSVVTPCYNEELTVEECYEAVRRICEEQLPGYDYEHIFCDNASTDATPGLLRDLARRDPRVKVILNARNFGPFRSLFNGLMATSGDGVLAFLPADLQDPPELLPEFVAKWEEGFEVVQGIRRHREEGWLIRSVRKIYYRMVSRLANISIPIDVGEFQFIDRQVVDALRQCDDYYPYIRGLIASCGFRAVGIPFTWRARKKGFSKNRLYHLIDQGLNGVISFTNLPMRLCMFAGLVIAALSVLFAALTLAVNLLAFRPLSTPGIPTLIVAVFFFSGLQLFFFGVLGEYIAAIHSQVRKRPLVVERLRLNFERPSGRADGPHAPGGAGPRSGRAAAADGRPCRES
jgi:glycosyltransferase involved in cell wall biosynthesis